METRPYMHEMIDSARGAIRTVGGVVEYARMMEASAQALRMDAKDRLARDTAREAAELLRLFRAIEGEWSRYDDVDGEEIMEAVACWLADEERPIPRDEDFVNAPVEQSREDGDWFRATLQGHVYYVLREEDVDVGSDGESYIARPSFSVRRRVDL